MKAQLQSIIEIEKIEIQIYYKLAITIYFPCFNIVLYPQYSHHGEVGHPHTFQQK